MPYVILSDSSCDLSQEKARQIGVDLVPLSFTLEGKTYRDNFGQDMDPQDFYARVRSGLMPKTSLVNTDAFMEFFTPYLQQGKDILYIAFSSALSGTCQCAVQAMEMLKEQFPERKVAVVDSLCASLGQGLLVYRATQKRDAGCTLEETVQWLEENKLKVVHWFTVDDINHLFRGGRVKRIAALLGTVLKVKPVMHVNNAGELELVEKVLGRKKAIADIAGRIAESIRDEAATVFISHGDCLQEAEQLGALIKAKAQIKELYIHYVGPVIGSHSGPGTLAIFCLGTPR